MTVQDDALNAQMQLESDLKTVFNVSAYTRSISQAVRPYAKTWGSQPVDGETIIYMGVDLEPDDPKAATLPARVSHGNTQDIPVVYYTCKPIRPQYFP